MTPPDNKAGTENACSLAINVVVVKELAGTRCCCHCCC